MYTDQFSFATISTRTYS